MSASDDKRRFDAMLPFYVTGALDSTDRAWIEAYLEREPAARAELEWHDALARAIEARYASVPADVGRARLEQRLAGERGSAKAGLLALLERLLPRAALYPAFAIAAGLVVVQAIVISVLVTRPHTPEYDVVRSLGSAVEQSYLQINFKPQTTEREIRLALIRAGGTIVHGPGQLGDYYVAVPAPRLEAVRRELEAAPIVDSIALVTKLPERER